MPKKMTEQEKQDFQELCEYVKKVIGYTDDMKLSKQQILRLIGIKNGQFIANNKAKKQANYPYNVIKATFMYCKPNIQKALNSKRFKDENAKFNYVCAIVDNNINEVIMRLANAQKSKKESQRQIEKIEVDIFTPSNNCNKSSTNVDNINNKFNNLTKEMW